MDVVTANAVNIALKLESSVLNAQEVFNALDIHLKLIGNKFAGKLHRGLPINDMFEYHYPKLLEVKSKLDATHNKIMSIKRKDRKRSIRRLASHLSAICDEAIKIKTFKQNERECFFYVDVEDKHDVYNLIGDSYLVLSELGMKDNGIKISFVHSINGVDIESLEKRVEHLKTTEMGNFEILLPMANIVLCYLLDMLK